MIRSMDHNEEQITWAEQTEIELQNFLTEFDATVWPMFQRFGYSKDAALSYWMNSYINQRLANLLEVIEPPPEHFG